MESKIPLDRTINKSYVPYSMYCLIYPPTSSITLFLSLSLSSAFLLRDMATINQVSKLFLRIDTLVDSFNFHFDDLDEENSKISRFYLKFRKLWVQKTSEWSRKGERAWATRGEKSMFIILGIKFPVSESRRNTKQKLIGKNENEKWWYYERKEARKLSKAKQFGEEKLWSTISWSCNLKKY